VEKARDQKGPAFVMHGLSGNKDQSHIETIADAFQGNGYTVVRFDTTNTFGESDGNYEDATTTNYYEDLEDVIAWASILSWYQEPFVLAGHSLGGYSTARFAELHPEKIKALAPISCMISGKLTTESKKGAAILDEWKSTGWRIEPRESHPGEYKKLKWSHMEDRMKHDLLPDAGKLTMPVLMIVGDHDESTPSEHQRMLFDKLPGRKEFHIIKNAPHTFRDSKHLQEIKEIFDKRDQGGHPDESDHNTGNSGEDFDAGFKNFFHPRRGDLGDVNRAGDAHGDGENRGADGDIK
jgi:pimeloyl-ACP methyl ester carboxylesterase